MAAPLGDRTRLDAAVDAAVAVALVADELGDRAASLAFDREVRRRLAPAARGRPRGRARRCFDLEPRASTATTSSRSRRVDGAKRALVIVFTDLVDESAAQPLLDAVPVLARRHAVAVASVRDPDLDAHRRHRADERRTTSTRRRSRSTCSTPAPRVARSSAHAGARGRRGAAPTQLAAACVSAYLRAKARARL